MNVSEVLWVLVPSTYSCVLFEKIDFENLIFTKQFSMKLGLWVRIPDFPSLFQAFKTLKKSLCDLILTKTILWNHQITKMKNILWYPWPHCGSVTITSFAYWYHINMTSLWYESRSRLKSSHGLLGCFLPPLDWIHTSYDQHALWTKIWIIRS